MELSTRERMVLSTVLLVREKGARATSIDDVLTHSGAPRGSVYHHFPGGRSQLLREATEYASDFLTGRIESASSSLELLDRLLTGYLKQLELTDFRAGCPIVAVAVESGGDDDLHEHAAAAFDRWRDLLAKRLRADGLTPARSRDLALLVIASVEGAIVMARARRDAEPMTSVHRQLRALLRAELKGRT